ncbi:MAG: UDP-phosphate galactose phosphotransferase [Bdellovibrionaceae bacterium]|nr:UDP-phosphate galactose phosphotransferase [Pseudobdellovibrionaceae bacterium]|tara:strand:+ start:3782 stop:5209 length:1428 start_codon:yes stop_codon:yes gene_type:complete
MLKQRQEQIQIVVRLMDVVVAVGAFFIAYSIRSGSVWYDPGEIAPLQSWLWLLALSLLIHFIVYPALSFYESLRLKSVAAIISMILKSSVIEFFILGALVFFLKEKTTSRSFFGIYIGLNFLGLIFLKLGARTFLSSIRKRGYNFRQVLVIGDEENARRVIRALQRNHHWGYIPFGVLKGPGVECSVAEIEGVPILGNWKDLETVSRDRSIDEVYLAQNQFYSKDLQEQTALCEKVGIPIRITLGLFDLPHSKMTFSFLDDLPVMTYYTTLLSPFEFILKRALDIVVSLVGLVITGILYPWISYRIKKESPGPIIFKQVRVGENGRRFKCYKFRSMSLDAEKLKEGLKNQNQMDGPLFKIENDPRIFEFGHFLRRTSLDELPQFFNILRGDMSVVGTRPPTPDEVKTYETHYRRRLSIRPGLTGLWQVSGRNEIKDFEDVLRLDLKYIDQWSIFLDIQIIFKTIWVVLFKRKGAY